MRVELRIEARHDLVKGALFYERQRERLGDYFTDCLFEDFDRLESEAGVHAIVYGLHRKLSKKFPYAIYYRTGTPGWPLRSPSPTRIDIIPFMWRLEKTCQLRDLSWWIR